MSTTKCTKCGAANPIGMPVCRQCGSPLPKPAPAAAQPKQANSSVLQPGQIVANRYRVMGIIGRGGMGAIYRVHDNVLNEQVALKTLLPQFARDKTVIERFYNEARIARQLSHPNIVRVHDIGMAGQTMYISMEFMEGKSLRALLEELPQGRSLPVAEKLRILDQLCVALEYAHRFTIHRDIKPENVMVTTDGTVKLMDFGISKLMAHTRLTMTSMVMGTPQYMSPEQFRDSGNVDARADIYSLGVLLYEMFTGDVPTGISKPVSQITSEVPPALDPVIAKCLESNPSNRYQTVQELREALAEVRKSLVGGAPAVASAPAPAPQQRGGAWLSVLVRIAAILLVAAGAAWGSWRLLSNEAPPSPHNAGQEPDAPLPGDVRLPAALSLLDRVRAQAQDQVKDSEEKKKILETAQKLSETAADPGQSPDLALAMARDALMCYAGILLWPEDDSMTFIPPGAATIEDPTGSSVLDVDGFFIDRRQVTNGMFLSFCQQSPEHWRVPAHIQGNTNDSEFLGAAVFGLPFFSAQAFAAWGEKKAPSEAQWARAAAAVEAEGWKIEGLTGSVSEWTRTAYGPLPYDATDNRSDADRPNFATMMVVRGGGPQDDSKSGMKARYSVPYEYERTDPRIGFRCVKELPASIEALAALLSPSSDGSGSAESKDSSTRAGAE